VLGLDMKKLLGAIIILFLIGCDQAKDPVVKNERYLKCSSSFGADMHLFVLIKDALITEKLYGTLMVLYNDETFTGTVSDANPTLYTSDKFFVFGQADDFVFIINRLDLSAGLVEQKVYGVLSERNDYLIEKLIKEKNYGPMKCEKVSKPKKQI
tara:strand:- start:121 stop:582 length:462 start_codon:yes stop_codon:yes gene_type:complete